MSDLETAVRAASSRDLPRAELSAAIVARLEQLGAPPESIAAAKKIAQPGSVVVVAGQQPVVLGGPMFVWSKALDVIALANTLEARHGVPVVPVFWNASEDHDHAEVDHVDLLLDRKVERFAVTLPGDRRMLSRVPVTGEHIDRVYALKDKIVSATSMEVFDSIRPSMLMTIGTWFSRVMLGQLGGRGLVVVEPDWLRGFARSVVDVEIHRPGALAATIRTAEDALVGRGEARPLDLKRDALFFLVNDDGRRLRVEHDGASWRVEDGRTLSSHDLDATSRYSFSWNVAGRVLAQDVALPVAAQVCGPAEIRYCGLLVEAHALLGVPTPALVARTHWAAVPLNVDRACEELRVTPESVVERGAVAFGAVRDYVEPFEVGELRDVVRRLPLGGSAAVQRSRASLSRGVDLYAEAVRRDAVEASDVRDARVRRAVDVLHPGGEPQERRLTPLPWMQRLLQEHDRLAGAEASAAVHCFRIG